MTYIPTEAELEILKILWEQGPSSVRTVNDKLNQMRPVGYTTTLKMMQIMNEKGLTERDTSARTHIYSAKIKEEATKSSMLENFLSSAYNGSAKSLILNALGNHKTSPEELDEIKELIAKIEKERL